MASVPDVFSDWQLSISVTSLSPDSAAESARGSAGRVGALLMLQTRDLLVEYERTLIEITLTDKSIVSTSPGEARLSGHPGPPL